MKRCMPVLVLGLGVALCGCGEDAPPSGPSFNKIVPEVEERFHGKALSTWRDYESRAPVARRALTGYALAALEKEAIESAPLLLELVRDAHPSVQLGGVIGAGRLAPPSTELAEAIADLLESPEEPLRRHARKALARLGKAALEPLLRRLSSEKVGVRWGAAVSLAGLGDAGHPAIQKLADMATGDSHRAVREQALLTLGRLGPDGVARVIPWLEKDQYFERSRAERALAGAKEDAVDPLRALLKHERPEVAAVAAGVLADLGPIAAPAIPDLIEALTHTGPLRLNAAEALVAIGKQALPYLEEPAGSKKRDLALVSQRVIQEIESQ